MVVSVQEKVQQFEFVLGSTSPRRLEILERNLGVKVSSQIGSDFAEDLDHSKYPNPVDYVSETAKYKFDDIVSNKLPIVDVEYPCIVLAADTIVACGKHILEKPIDPDTQREFFRIYERAPEVNVITAVVVGLLSEEGKLCELASAAETTTLEFNATPELIDYYIDTTEGLEAAGGFKYQEKGGLLFPTLKGDYFNVVGLPVRKTHELLEQVLRNTEL